MFKFMLDTNVISQANHQLYPPDNFPGFWDWLQIENRSERIFSIISVYEELTAMGYTFEIWNDDIVNAFFLKDKQVQVQQFYAEISNYVANHTYIKSKIKEIF